MKHPLQITVRNMSLSDAAKAAIQEKAAKLEEFDDRIIGCRVLVEVPHKHHHQGVLYNVRIDLTVPGAEIVVKREPHEDLYVAIRDAFDAAARQLRQRRRKQDIEGVLPRPTPKPEARVIRLFPAEGYGFLETRDGREIYFHRNSVLHNAFDRLGVGTRVRYVEEQGEKGPQASTVEVVSRRTPAGLGVASASTLSEGA